MRFRPGSVIAQDSIDEMVVVASRAPVGNIAEVGVYRGGSAWHLAVLARARNVKLYLYDTFSGMPFSDEGDGIPAGEFSDTSVALVQEAIPDAVLLPGEFPATCIDMRPLAFVHVDCDQYRSVRACIDHLCPQLLPGGVMWFDDYGYLESARRAVDQMFSNVTRTAAGRVYVTKPS